MRFWDDLDVYDYAASQVLLSEEDRANLVKDLERKFRLPTPPPPDFLDTLSPEVRKRVEVLKDIQDQHDKLEVKFLEERAAHEAKYLNLYEPLYTKRYEIVNGVVEVEGVTNEAPMDQKEDKFAKEKGVPNFWLNALRTNELLEDGISKCDERALKYLKDVKWCGIDKHKGFKLEFFFDANPYFKNSTLSKTYQTIDYNDDTSVEEAIGTEIEWYSGKNLTETLPGKGSKNAQPITKRQKIDSFFNFFNPPQISTDGYDVDVGHIEGFRYQMKEDYDIGLAQCIPMGIITGKHIGSAKWVMSRLEKKMTCHEFDAYYDLCKSHFLSNLVELLQH